VRTFHHIPELRTHLRAARDEGLAVGLVPTMGALHAGHLALIERSQTECDRTVVSIFVNPTQFGPGEDLERYPRDLAGDSRACQEAGVDALFAPSTEEMYPAGPGDAAARTLTRVCVSGLTERYEGAVRPGHFEGVATVCAKLFQIVQPNRAYFGQKDYQQLLVVQRMVADLNMPLAVVPVPTVREPDGLALSSRNAYLTPEERAAGTALYRALQEAARLFGGGERSAEELKRSMHAILGAEPEVAVDYAEVADIHRLSPLDTIGDEAIALGAIRVGQTRLLDNVLLGATLNQHPRRAN